MTDLTQPKFASLETVSGLMFDDPRANLGRCEPSGEESKPRPNRAEPLSILREIVPGSPSGVERSAPGLPPTRRGIASPDRSPWLRHGS